MEFVKKSIGKWIEAALVLTIGILIIIAGAQLGKSGYDWSTHTFKDVSADVQNAISLVVGIAFIVIGSLALIAAGIASVISRKGFAAAASGAGMTLAVGIWFVVVRQAAEILMILLGFVPYALIVAGSVWACDAIFGLVNALRDKSVKKAVPAFIVGLALAAVSIVLGTLCLVKNGDGTDTIISQGAQWIILGILVVIYAAYLVLATFVPSVDVVVIKTASESEKKPVVTDAEVTEEKKED